ncbi:MAG: hypothetical protein HDS25_00425 [Bacteroides sp.]|nr:hypothetical protein [Bacteroides sp.]
MKKILLAAAMLSATSGVFAQDGLMNFNECFALTYEGKSIAAGETINVAHFTEADPDIFGDGYVSYEANIQVENLDIMPQYIRGVFRPDQKPTGQEYLADRFFWGDPQLCYSITNASGATGNCLLGDLNNPVNPTFAADNVAVPVSTAGTFEWQIHVNACEKAADATYPLTLQAVEVADPTTPSEYVALSEPITIYLTFNAANSGVEAIDADNAEGVYYDLQGRRVDNPSQGIYIYKTGAKAVKRVVK